MKVQIVDDNDTNLLLFSQLVKGMGSDLDIQSFLDPREAIERCAVEMPDLVLVDYMMPEMDGHQFIAALRAIPGSREVPIVMITAADERAVRHKALELGASDFIAKPIDPTEVKARLRNLLTLRRNHLKLKDRNAWLGTEVRKATQTILDREHELVLRLAKAAEYRDPETGGHIQRMARYCRLIATGLGLPADEVDDLFHAAPMHDLGKLGIPDGVLLKPGRLDEAEFRVMKEHAQMGHAILDGSSSRLLQSAAEIALSHHEKWDGGGYPQGLKGADIPLSGRIVAVADVFDALTSVRPYKPAWPLDKAKAFIEDNAGSHFDPDCVRIFLDAWTEVLAIYTQFKDEQTDDTASLPEL